LPSARNSAARCFIAARSAAVKPPDPVWELFADIATLPFDPRRLGAVPAGGTKTSPLRQGRSPRFQPPSAPGPATTMVRCCCGSLLVRHRRRVRRGRAGGAVAAGGGAGVVPAVPGPARRSAGRAAGFAWKIGLPRIVWYPIEAVAELSGDPPPVAQFTRTPPASPEPPTPAPPAPVNGHWEIRLGGLVFSGLAATSFPGWWPRVLPAGGG
jgi:hypothetical protein